ncbi:biotin transport system permease protein [Agromyces flavus]|uniref:Biotin transport system permease protein n=1 Tax=Agromyces flavus TaxID=589382 RepID=A0A1H1PDC4_9MICO|nr:energy-coupling factor transporter transmembrane protein EcfT [Agromyces flavus]MCP2367943.1 biotin transport system permease protein [Agromyces flavus]GGI47405.1 cobalt ABC transporter permease [Agromyces flavus]SDS09266.1 biotin transport system permease protein [Agromyces flavus]
MIGVYHPGTSVVHRAAALAKLGLLAVAVTLVALLPSLHALGIAAPLVVGLIVLARIPARLAWRQITPILWLLAFAVPVQWIFAGWEAAATMGLRLVLAVALAAVYTLTTPVSATLDAMQALLRPFRRWVDPDRIGLALALAIRCVPLLAELVREVLEARKARGAEGSPTALAVPVIVRALRTADHLGEALMARGVED